jgi:DNA-binding FrmR family transcriptional regulator
MIGTAYHGPLCCALRPCVRHRATSEKCHNRAQVLLHRRLGQIAHMACIGWGPMPNNGMAHTIREKQKLLARVRRIRGQVDGIERSLNDEAGCEQVMHLIAGVRGAIAGLMAEVVGDHVREHLVDTKKYPTALDTVATDQLLEVVRAYMK